MPNIDTSQFEEETEKALQNGLSSDLKDEINAGEIASVLAELVANALKERGVGIFASNDNKETQLSKTLDEFGDNPQGKPSGTQEQSPAEGSATPSENNENAPPESGRASEENTQEGESKNETETPENQEDGQESEEKNPESSEKQDNPESQSTDQETKEAGEEKPSDQEEPDGTTEKPEDNLGFDKPADHPATDEQEDQSKKKETDGDAPENKAAREQAQAQQLAGQQQASRMQQQKSASTKNQAINTLTNKKGELLKKASGIALKGTPILRIILGVTDTIDVVEFEDGALISALTSPIPVMITAFYYVLQNGETKKYIAKSYLKKGIGIAALEIIPIINIFPWDTFNTWMLARDVKKGKEGYNKEAQDIAAQIKKIESNQNH